MANKPTLISYTDTAFNAAGTVTTASISWQMGDIVLTLHGNEGSSGVLGTPTTTGTGLAFSVIQSITTVSACAVKVSFAQATATSTGTISASNTTGDSGLGVYVWRGSQGIGVSAQSSTTAQTVAMAPSSTHSAICWCTFDFHVDAIGSLAPTPTTTREAVSLVSHYNYYIGEIQDQATTGSQNWGVTGGGTTGPFSNVAVEILGKNSLPNNYQFIKAGDGMSVSEKLR